MARWKAFGRKQKYPFGVIPLKCPNCKRIMHTSVIFPCNYPNKRVWLRMCPYCNREIQEIPLKKIYNFKIKEINKGD